MNCFLFVRLWKQVLVDVCLMLIDSLNDARKVKAMVAAENLRLYMVQLDKWGFLNEFG